MQPVFLKLSENISYFCGCVYANIEILYLMEKIANDILTALKASVSELEAKLEQTRSLLASLEESLAAEEIALEEKPAASSDPEPAQEPVQESETEAVPEPAPVVEQEAPVVADEPEQVPEPASEPQSEPVSEPVAIPAVEEEPSLLDEPEPAPAEEEPIDLGIGDLDVSDIISDLPESINDVESANVKPAVMDVMAEKCAWKADMPGSPVKNVLSAISLNDRILFIKSLFKDDAAVFQQTIQTFNSYTMLSEAEDYIHRMFPDWKMNSEVVYRFMMAVRRKLK